MENRRENLTIGDYTKMIDGDPNNYNLYVYRGLCHWNNGNFDKAKNDFTKAIELNSLCFEAYNNRAIIYSDEKQYDLALTDHSMCIKINPWAVDGYVNRGSFYYDMLHDYKSAIEDFSRAIELDPTDYEVYLFRSMAYNFLGEEKLAEADVKKAFEIDPLTTESWFKRRTSPPLDPDSAKAHILNGLESFGSHEYDIAIIEATKVIEIGSPADIITAYNNRGMAHAAKANRGMVHAVEAEYALAIEDYKKALALNPEYTRGYSNIGAAYFHIKEYDLAIENLTQAIEHLSTVPNLNPDETKRFLNSLYYRGLSFTATHRFYFAKKDFEKILDINPNDDEVRLLLRNISSWI